MKKRELNRLELLPPPIVLHWISADHFLSFAISMDALFTFVQLLGREGMAEVYRCPHCRRSHRRTLPSSPSLPPSVTARPASSEKREATTAVVARNGRESRRSITVDHPRPSLHDRRRRCSVAVPPPPPHSPAARPSSPLKTKKATGLQSLF
ncbi:hypothetical protein MRB53_013375 [Persea americana]|uniref:Uncharacterized protein n=1 Tax=Persea americana TaxID=3435 RepID=A0ACC2K8A1_PERAE|nr:hypothetical protein MRB53_013375 [Persea americana]